MKINAYNRLSSTNTNMQAFNDGRLLIYCTDLLEKIVGGKFSKTEIISDTQVLVYFTGANADLSFDSTTLQGIKAIMAKKVMLSCYPDRNSLVFSLESI